MEIIDESMQEELAGKGKNIKELVVSQTGGTELNPFASKEAFASLWDMGKMLATSELIPQNYRGKPMDCCVALDMANRMNVAPLMVMQNLYVVQGKPSWSGQACKTLISGSKKFTGIKHRYIGEPNTDSWGCYLEATRIEDNELVKGPTVTIGMAKAEGWYQKKSSKWQTLPELMLAYRASAFFARVHVPESLMGIYVEGEAEDILQSRNRTYDVPNPMGGNVDAVKQQ